MSIRIQIHIFSCKYFDFDLVFILFFWFIFWIHNKNEQLHGTFALFEWIEYWSIWIYISQHTSMEIGVRAVRRTLILISIELDKIVILMS